MESSSSSSSSSSNSIDIDDIPRRKRSLSFHRADAATSRDTMQARSSRSILKRSTMTQLRGTTLPNVHHRPSLSRKDTKTVSSVLRVVNLDRRLDDRDVRSIFDVYGDIVSVRVYYNMVGVSTGTADVVFTQRTSAINAHDAINRGTGIPGCKGLKASIIHWYCPKGLAKK